MYGNETNYLKRDINTLDFCLTDAIRTKTITCQNANEKSMHTF